MYVYLVWYLSGARGATLLKVVDSEEKAEAEAENCEKRTGYDSYYTEEEVE